MKPLGVTSSLAALDISSPILLLDPEHVGFRRTKAFYKRPGDEELEDAFRRMTLVFELFYRHATYNVRC